MDPRQPHRPAPLLLPRHWRTDRQPTRGDVRRQGPTQNSRHDVGRERGRVQHLAHVAVVDLLAAASWFRQIPACSGSDGRGPVPVASVWPPHPRVGAWWFPRKALSCSSSVVRNLDAHVSLGSGEQFFSPRGRQEPGHLSRLLLSRGSLAVQRRTSCCAPAALGGATPFDRDNKQSSRLPAAPFVIVRSCKPSC